MQIGSASPLILLVDDEAANRREVVAYLEEKRPEWRLQTFSGLTDLEAWLGETPEEPIVVVTDLVMEHEQAGVTVLRRIRDLYPLCSVLLVTAFEERLQRYDAFAQGAFDCISKNATGVHPVEEIDIKVASAVAYRREVNTRIRAETDAALAGRHLDPRVSAALRSGNEALISPARRNLTVVFWDIRGFSALSETLKESPTSVTDFLRDYFEAAVGCVEQHAGILDKFIGDGVMALFGLDEPMSDDAGATAAVAAAKELASAFGALLPPWKARWDKVTAQQVSVGLGCGMHTGQALVGNIGTSSRDQFTALGPVVNLAARLESRAERADSALTDNERASTGRRD